MIKAVTDALIESGFKIIETDELIGIIRAKAAISLRSWGEDIEVRLLKTPQGTQVTMSSDSLSDLIDWGKSKENVRIFFNNLNKRILD